MSEKQIVNLLCKDNAILVLNSLQASPLTPDEICLKTGVPLTSVYRSLRLMVKYNLVKSVGMVINSNSKRQHAYYAMISGVEASFKLGESKFKITFRDCPENFDRVYVHQWKDSEHSKRRNEKVKP